MSWNRGHAVDAAWNDVTAVIPAIPPRVENGLLGRALASVAAQTRPVRAISVAVDTGREGAPPTRQRSLDAARTEWVAFLDDDDEWLPQHVDHLLACALATGADLVYSWFKVVAVPGLVLEHDPVFPPTHFTEPFDPAHPIEVTSTVLVRTELAREVGFKALADRTENTGEDWGFLLGCLEVGGKVEHLVEKTWLWHHDSMNTSGRPDRW